MSEQEKFLRDLINRLAKLNCVFDTNVDFSKLSPFRIGGGNACVVVRIRSLKELQILNSIIGEEFYILGRGSNTFFRGESIQAPIIKLVGEFDKIEKISATKFRLYAGAHFDQVCRALSKDGYSGLEFGVGIPGTVGGAIKMNAGAHGSEIANIITEVCILYEGKLEIIKPDFGYRFSSIPSKAVILWGDIHISQAKTDMIMSLIRRNLDYRKATQPLEYPSLGSVFKNPESKSAGEILEHLGFKGLSIGGCKFSEKHANWIINYSKKGTYKDVEELLYLAIQRVKESFLIDLELEWVVLGSQF